MTATAVPVERTAVRGGAARPAVPEHRFRHDVEGLRAVAVGLVLLDHVFGWPSGGFVGVDVFFVISGFLITGLLVRERQRTGRISFRAFYVRRARRLMPAAVTTLVVTTLAAWVLFVDGRFRNTVTDGLWALFFGANVNFARQGTDYFQTDAAPSPFQHFWSLAVEEQFYLLWPVLVLAVFALTVGRRRGRTAVLGLAVLAVTAASFAWSLHATSTAPETAYFSTFTRAWELGVGALVAVTAAGLHRLPARLQAVLAWAGLAGVVASAFLITATTPFPGSAAALPVLSTALLVAFGAAPGGPGVRWALGSAPARFLGRISYSLYLWHWPVVVVLAAVLDPESVVYHAVVLALSLSLATISFHVVEQPVLHSRWLLPRAQRRTRHPAAPGVFRRARAVAGGSAATAIVLTAGLLLVSPPGQLDARAVAAADAALRAEAEARAAAEDGGTAEDPLTREIRAASVALTWPTDLSPSLDDLPDYLRTQWSEGCFDVRPDNVAECVYGDPAAPQRAVVLGDSIAGAWLPGIVSGLTPQGWSVQTLSMGRCPNVLEMTLVGGQPFTECSDHRQWALGWIAQNSPDLVVLSNAYDAELADPALDRTAVFRDGLTSMVRQIQASGARVVVLGAPPETGNLQSCANGLSEPADCAESPSRSYLASLSIEAEVAEATGATAVDPQRWFCVDDLCPPFVGGTPVFADGVHMTAEYSERIGGSVAEALLES
ncbi:Peptidoglycan/LPS O-acetylase OafA/YrhL, contains acyltransferase and SGNH-hydrolase domains [Geodermatophilus siccatus]|uniref:Peptidoglycan/LPS O-acetylase OafA/YrhL, contains acyltransferase and SGNH-hydrolase domains n=1 Tax=Geodermatophilus siccatus TaxID=1137991 RepID=A0A1G9PQ44_9ACTN|nr:acyltransferase family protein [Geodermatophilus siccatus]SDM00900.1 Peptidoglycan/LPS O-acetylase OafA/YrhL, contains acyltransferase and SGNH-hydrolase domains [Geodermatophilus siccatus]